MYSIAHWPLHLLWGHMCMHACILALLYTLIHVLLLYTLLYVLLLKSTIVRITHINPAASYKLLCCAPLFPVFLLGCLCICVCVWGTSRHYRLPHFLHPHPHSHFHTHIPTPTPPHYHHFRCSLQNGRVYTLVWVFFQTSIPYHRCSSTYHIIRLIMGCVPLPTTTILVPWEYDFFLSSSMLAAANRGC